MNIVIDDSRKIRIDDYFCRLGKHLPDVRQRASFAMYAFGLFSNLERKSVEPIAALTCPDPQGCKTVHGRLLDFLNRGRWEDRPIRLAAARYAVEELSQREDVDVWVIDDTGFLKQGKQSVGVQRQYTGSAGKTTNCQIGVSLSIATRNEQLPIDFELYIPESWASDPERSRAARIPEDHVFKTKIALAMEMIERAAAASIPGKIILADSAYGESVKFRQGARALGFDIGVGIHGPTKVWLVDSQNRTVGTAISAQKLGTQLAEKAFRTYTWREATNGKKLQGRFCFRRVKVAADDGTPLEEREVLWLMMEWPESETTPTKFSLTSMPRRMSKKQIVRVVKERWKTERVYEEMKGELGLDHYEGRSFPGWNHHVSVAICCYVFIVAERARLFPPPPGREGRSSPVARAA